MRNMFKKPHNVMLYEERNEFQEFGRAKKNYRQCLECHALYFNKSWHGIKHIEPKIINKSITIVATLCPACEMIKQNQYEGFILIENIPQKYEKSLYKLIESYSKKAIEMDCQHRLIKINKYSKNDWVVTTTENQMANKLAHKIKDVFDKIKIRTVYSQAPDDVVRVKVSFN